MLAGKFNKKVLEYCLDSFLYHHEFMNLVDVEKKI